MRRKIVVQAENLSKLHKNFKAGVGMKLKQKFMMLAWMMGFSIALVCVISYIFASNELQSSVDSELQTTVAKESAQLNGWLETKRAFGESTANELTSVNGNMSLLKSKEILGTITSDKEILEMSIGLNDGYFYCYYAGDITGQLDPTGRLWYKNAREFDKPMFTAPYVDVNTKSLIVSVGAPIKANGQFIGANCLDLSLEVLGKQVSAMNYHGEGAGIITEANGNILATAQLGEVTKNFREIDGIGTHFDDMVSQGSGYFEVTVNDEDLVFAYTTIPATGWLLGITVPTSSVFAPLRNLRILFVALIVLGFISAFAICLWIAGKITTPVTKLEEYSIQLSKGNLSMVDLPVTSNDEIGSLTRDFNTMKKNLSKLIATMSTNSEQVAASSQQLTASSQQSADASVHVAETVNEVSAAVNNQMNDINAAKGNIDTIFTDIKSVERKSREVAETSHRTSAAAQKGSELMTSAVDGMGRIETSVLASADVVKKLGENSRQIGQIVETIAAISDQTNLLALNAAIEAARAGEHGRGFAVVSEEVRKLAEQSSEAAEQIKVRIASIQQDTEDAVNAMQSGTDEVKAGTGAIREVGVQFTEILSMVNDIRIQMDEINSAVQTVSNEAAAIVKMVDSIDEISKKTSENMRTISSATEEQSASNEEIAAASLALAKMAEDMQNAIGQFHV